MSIIKDGDYIHFSFVPLQYELDESNNNVTKLEATEKNFRILVNSLVGNDKVIRERWNSLKKYVFEDIRAWILPYYESEWFYGENPQIYLTINNKNEIVINMSAIIRQYDLNYIKKDFEKTYGLNKRFHINNHTEFTMDLLKYSISEGLWKDTNEGEFIVPGIGGIFFDNDKSDFELKIIKLKRSTNKLSQNKNKKRSMY